MPITVRLLPRAALIATFALSAAAQSQGPWDNLIVRGAIMIDGTGAPPKGPVDIYVSKNVIQRIQAHDPISLATSGSSRDPAGAHVIDANGMYIIPGLIDMHMHFSGEVPLDVQAAARSRRDHRSHLQYRQHEYRRRDGGGEKAQRRESDHRAPSLHLSVLAWRRSQSFGCEAGSVDRTRMEGEGCGRSEDGRSAW